MVNGTDHYDRPFSARRRERTFLTKVPLGECDMCPYFIPSCNNCNFYSTYQDGYHKDNYCLSGYSWKRCANYEKSSNIQKIERRVR